jgi:hypothetical protein
VRGFLFLRFKTTTCGRWINGQEGRDSPKYNKNVPVWRTSAMGTAIATYQVDLGAEIFDDLGQIR